MPFGHSNDYDTNFTSSMIFLGVVSIKAFIRFPQDIGVSSAAYIDLLEQINKPGYEKEDLMYFAKTLQHHTVLK